MNVRARNATWAVLLLVLLVVGVLFAPITDIGVKAPRLSTFSHDRSGARGLYETAARLGWRPVRNLSADPPPERAGTAYAVLAPGIPLTPLEIHALLERVRAGAGLFVVAEVRTPLADSLRVQRSTVWGPIALDSAADCPPARPARLAEALRGNPWVTALQVLPGGPVDPAVLLRVSPPGVTATVERDTTASVPAEPTLALIGFPLGRGRVAIVSDPALLSNDMFRNCRSPIGVAVMQLLAYVSSDAAGNLERTHLIFDEYHHGHGRHPSVVRTTARFAREHPLGRTLTQASLAGIIIVTALGLRPVATAPPQRRSRRSPLEHVQALALAYAQVPATRTGTRLLVRGLRRRLRRTSGYMRAAMSDDEFLRELAELFPAIRADTEIVQRALAATVPAGEFARVGQAISRIERTISDSQ